MNYAFCLRWRTIHKERLGGLLLRCRSQNSNQPFQVLAWVTFSHSLPRHRQKSPNLKSWADFCYCAVIIHFARTFFERKLNEWISPATASQSLGGHQRKMFLAFRICARPISSKKERTFFFGVLPSKYPGRWRNNADEVWGVIFHLLLFLFWRNSVRAKNTKSISILSRSFLC